MAYRPCRLQRGGSMTLREMADQIRREGGHPESYVTPPRADGTRRTVWGDEITATQWGELLRMTRPVTAPVATEEQKAKWRALAAHARARD